LAGGSFKKQTDGRPSDEYKELIRKGKNLMAEGNWAKAIACLADAVKIARGEKRPDWEIEALRLVGETLWKRGDPDKALAYYNKAIKLAKEKEDRLGLSKALRGLGTIYMSKGDLDKAEELFDVYLEVAQKIGLQTMIGIGYIDKATIDAERGHLIKAIENYKEGISLLEGTEEHVELSRAYGELGEAYMMSGDYGTAKGFFERAMDECSKFGNIHAWAYSELKVAECCTKLGFVIRAMEHLESSREILMRLKDQPGLGEVYRISGVLMTSQGNWSAAESHLDKSVQLLTEQDRPIDLVKAQIEQGRMYLLRGKMPEAKRVLENAMELTINIKSKRLAKIVDNLLKEIK
jgi:tetratricopeptide (TPR) repeat protein